MLSALSKCAVKLTATLHLPLYGEVTLMELASILLITIITVVLLLQVIALVQIAGMRKALQEIKETKTAPAVAPAAPAPSPERFERKGGDFRRHEKRPYQQDQRPRPQQQQQSQAPAPAAATPVAAVDPVETSLRDINLRLKNAERDQEFARKKIHENLGDRDQQYRSHDRNDRDRSDRDRGDRSDRGGDRNRDGGDREGGRDRNRGSRDGNRDRNRGPRRDNWQPQGNRSPSQQPALSAASPVQGDEQPTFEKQPFAAAPSAAATFPTAESVETMIPSISAVPEAAVFSPAPVQAPNQAPDDYSGSDEGMEHGRKVLVKRRPLRDEDSEGSDQNSAKEEATAEPSVSSGTEIQFGRRKGL